MKKIMYLIAIVLFATLVVAGAKYKDYEFFVKDTVRGRNLEVIEFDEELGLINNMLYLDMVQRDFNTFKGRFEFGVPIGSDDWYINAQDVQFSGNLRFNDKSYVKYKVTNFELQDLELDQYGATQAFGNAILTYEATVKIKKEIPVEVIYDFYQDVEDKESWGQFISIKGEEINIELKDSGKQKYRHRRRCYKGCEE